MCAIRNASYRKLQTVEISIRRQYCREVGNVSKYRENRISEMGVWRVSTTPHWRGEPISREPDCDWNIAAEPKTGWLNASLPELDVFQLLTRYLSDEVTQIRNSDTIQRRGDSQNLRNVICLISMIFSLIERTKRRLTWTRSLSGGELHQEAVLRPLPKTVWSET